MEGRSGREAIERAAELTGGGEASKSAAAAAAGANAAPAAALPPSSSSSSSSSKKGLSFFSSLPLLMKPSPRRAALAWPFLFFLVAPRILSAVKEASLAALTPRIAAALPEVPLLLAAVGGVGGVVLARMSDVLPFVAWRWFVVEEKEEKKEKEREEKEE